MERDIPAAGANDDDGGMPGVSTRQIPTRDTDVTDRDLGGARWRRQVPYEVPFACAPNARPGTPSSALLFQAYRRVHMAVTVEHGMEPVVHRVTRGPAGFVSVYTTDYLTAVLHTNFAPTGIRAWRCMRSAPVYSLVLGHLRVLRVRLLSIV